MSAETAFSVIAHALSLWSRPWAFDLLREIGGASAAELEDAILMNALALTTDLGVGVMPADDDVRDEALKGQFRARVQSFFFNVESDTIAIKLRLLLLPHRERQRHRQRHLQLRPKWLRPLGLCRCGSL